MSLNLIFRVIALNFLYMYGNECLHVSLKGMCTNNA